MGVLEEMLNEDNTYAYDGDEVAQYDEQGFSVGKFRNRLRLGSPSIRPLGTAQQPIIRPATPQQPYSVGTRDIVSKAQFDLVISRSTQFIARGQAPNNPVSNIGDLQCVLFASDAKQSYYASLLNYTGSAQFIGVDGGGIYNPSTALIVNYPKNGIRFLYIVGYDEGLPIYQQITITCVQTDYPILLQSLGSDLMRANYLKYFVPTQAEVQQFSKRFDFTELSLFGKRTSDKIPVLSNVKSTDFKDRIIEMPVSIIIDKTKGILLDIDEIMTGKSVTLSFFVDYTVRQSV